MSNKFTGNYGETLACEYLKKLGFKILERNYRIRGGEIDIIAMDKDYLVFIEVKTRLSHEFGLPAESMTSWKIKHLLKAAQFYLLKIDWGDNPYRLDFVSVDFANNKQSLPFAKAKRKEKPEIELIKNITV